MSSTIANFGIAVGVTSVICFALMTRAQNLRRRRARAGSSGADGGSEYSTTSDSFGLGSWFSSNDSAFDASGNPGDGGSCSSGSDSSFGSDSGGGSDCGGGGDGGGGSSD